MTTMTLETTASVRRLEELVDRLLAAILGDTGRTAPSPAQAIHEARRLRQSGDLDGALEAFNGVDTADVADAQLRWLYAEWLDIARRGFAGTSAMLYSPDTGKAAVLVPASNHGGATLEVVAVLGMRWPVGKPVSRRSLRGLKPLHNKDCANSRQGGATWS